MWYEVWCAVRLYDMQKGSLYWKIQHEESRTVQETQNYAQSRVKIHKISNT